MVTTRRKASVLSMMTMWQTHPAFSTTTTQPHAPTLLTTWPHMPLCTTTWRRAPALSTTAPHIPPANDDTAAHTPARAAMTTQLHTPVPVMTMQALQCLKSLIHQDLLF